MPKATTLMSCSVVKNTFLLDASASFSLSTIALGCWPARRATVANCRSMNDAPEISGSEHAGVAAAVVIPAFNAAATIVETLRALQACPGVEELGGVFVCDDASTDNTSQLAAAAWTSM